jgi:hypothetical protein
MRFYLNNVLTVVLNNICKQFFLLRRNLALTTFLSNQNKLEELLFLDTLVTCLSGEI